MLKTIAGFRGVALFTILLGAGIFAYGVSTWYLNAFRDYNFYFPAFKIIGGWIIISLGYIHLNLELMRKNKSE